MINPSGRQTDRRTGDSMRAIAYNNMQSRVKTLRECKLCHSLQSIGYFIADCTDSGVNLFGDDVYRFCFMIREKNQ